MIKNLVEPDRVHRAVYTDPALFELEMDRLFGRAWLLLGHASQAPRPGDYFTTRMGREPVVVVRHTDDTLHVLVNRCAHRGSRVCEGHGHAGQLVCPYHGWTYDTNGALPHMGASLARSLPGFALGSAAGVLLGLTAGVARGVAQTVSPAVFLTYPVPKIVFLPLFMLWFGIGDLSKILIVALACFYPGFINAYYGARATPTIMVWSALNMGATRLAVFLKIVVPNALPLIFAGLRVSLALSFILLFSTEMINARSGLGFLIRQSEASLRFDLMYVSIVAVAVLGYASDRLLLFARRHALAWQDATT